MPLGFVGYRLFYYVIFAGKLFLLSSTEDLSSEYLLPTGVQQESTLLRPTVLITIIARNVQHSLPYFLGCIDRLDYPKSRIAIW